ncbi:hypothetical protein ACCO45_012569 [Purpureocillium lilacinum]|uniref:Uncharacterized protein n=1 Tax=Purpureocillium lilacinum TaxID=33203 RepID=A0ACC4D8T7_PURLI
MPRSRICHMEDFQARGQLVPVGLNEVKFIKFAEKSTIGAFNINGGYIIALGSPQAGIMAHADPSHEAVVTTMEQFMQEFDRHESEFSASASAACIMAANIEGVQGILLEETTDYIKSKMRELEVPSVLFKYDAVVEGSSPASGTAYMLGNRVNPRLPSWFFRGQACRLDQG